MENNDSWRDMANWIIWSELDARIDKMEDPEPSRILCVAHPVCIKTLLEKRNSTVNLVC